MSTTSIDNLFNQVSKNLASIGCIPLSEYLYGSPSIPPSSTQKTERPSTPPPLSQLSSTKVITKSSVDTLSANAISRLHHTCQRIFGSIDPLKFEFIEQDGHRTKKCILTISHPNGCTRSYATDPVYSRKAEAKSAAATLAIDMGALDFITHGQPQELKLQRGLVLASIKSSENSKGARSETALILPEPHAIDPVKQIEDCCVEWRGGCIAPHWVALLEPKLGRTQGCALSIHLSPHVAKVYASDPIHHTYNQAKVACAEAAIREGILEFIKHGNAQLRPASPQLFFPHSPSHINGVSPNKQPPLTLQAFYESLPRPFPESFESKDANEIGAPGYMNTLVQNARGGKLTMSFFFTSDNTPGLHGCFLRLDRPGEYKAYLVDPRFPKRADAKAAVCLQALSCGAGDYVRAIGKAVEAKVTPLMKTRANDQVYPVLLSEYSKVSSGHPNFSYEKDKDAFGCTMRLQLANDPTPDQIRKWTTSNEYRNKADARVAVICIAVEQGAIEFIRFRGESPPVGYTSPYSLPNYVPEVSQKSNGKRKMANDLPAEPEKPVKRRKKAKLEGVQCFREQQPGPSDTRARNYGGYVGGLYQPGLGGDSGSGPAYPTLQGDMLMKDSFPPLISNQHFMPHLHYSGQYGYPPPMQPYTTFPSPHHYLHSTFGRGAAARTETLWCESSEAEPGEVFDISQEGGGGGRS